MDNGIKTPIYFKSDKERKIASKLVKRFDSWMKEDVATEFFCEYKEFFYKKYLMDHIHRNHFDKKDLLFIKRNKC